MSFASSLPLALACCEAGILGGWQGGNVRTVEEFEDYLATLDAARRRAEGEGRPFAPTWPISRRPSSAIHTWALRS